MRYIKRTFKYYMLIISIFLAFNLYYIFLVPGMNNSYLYYLDLLLGVFFLMFLIGDYLKYWRGNRMRQELLENDSVIYRELNDLEDLDVLEHDIRVMQSQLQRTVNDNCELQDYIAKWCHEMKIPLAASMLINENIKDVEDKSNLRLQMEKMNQSLNTLLLGCKLQSSLFDLQIQKISLRKCVKTSIKNNQFFLIQKRFEMKIEVDDSTVYSDPAWVVYVLDQLIQNAVKYVREDGSSELHIWTRKLEGSVQLCIKDSGEGIKTSDISRIFEKGYTGSNYHNGRYKSTGMGLYMVAKILSRLGHEIEVESEYGKYTTFYISFLTRM